MFKAATISTAVMAAFFCQPYAAEFDNYGSAEVGLIAPDSGPNFIFEIGGGAKLQPTYEGSSVYEWTVDPIIAVDRLRIPGFVDLGGDDEAGVSFSPAIDVVGARTVGDHSELAGLSDIETTYALGAKIGYDFDLNDQWNIGGYGELLYGFGGSQGLLGAVGAEVTAKITPHLEIVAGASANFASENYMDTYFGVTSDQSVASGGRFDAFDPAAGGKSVGLDLSAKYEFLSDTFINASGSYTRFVQDAALSPIVRNGSVDNFTVSLGLSRRLGF